MSGWMQPQQNRKGLSIWSITCLLSKNRFRILSMNLKMPNDKSKESNIRVFFVCHSGNRISRLLDPAAIKPLLTQMWILPKSGLHPSGYHERLKFVKKISTLFYPQVNLSYIASFLSEQERREWHVAAPERLSSCWIKCLTFEHYHHHSSNLCYAHCQGIIVFR